MDQLELLRKVHEDWRPSDATRNEGKAILFGAIELDAGHHTSSRQRTRRSRAIGFSALGAGALTVALVLTNVVGLAGWRGGADAAAASVLQKAAHAAITTADIDVQPGHFLQVDTTILSTAGLSTATGDGEVQFRESYSLYVPAEQSDEWVFVRRPIKLERTWGPKSEEAAAGLPQESTVTEVERAANGEFDGHRSAFDPAGWPRDPYRVLNRIYLLTLGTGPSPDGEALVFIADALRQGTVPADLRAAMLEAAAMIPGVTIVDKQATLDGRSGVAIGRFEEGWGTRQEILIDPSTGQMIGTREVVVTQRPDSELAPGTVRSSSTISLREVSDAP